MCRTWTVVVVSSMLVLAGAARANEKPSEDYQKAMQANGATLQSLRANVKAIEAAGAYPDYTPLEKDMNAFKASFATTLAYWQAAKADDAVKFAQDGVKVTESLAGIIKDKDYRALVAASMAMGDSCAGCHMAHRVRLPDGTFEIK